MLAWVSLLAGCSTAWRWGAAPPPDSPTSTSRTLDAIQKSAAAAYGVQNWPGSERDYLEWTRRSPTDAEPWFKLGNIYGRTDRLDLAAKAYRLALQADPALTKAWHNLGIIQLQEALRTFTTLQLHADPNDPLARHGNEIKRLLEALLTPPEISAPKATSPRSAAGK